MRPFAAPPAAARRADAFASDVQYYLGLEPRQLPSRYLYDALGSILFEAICELPWYGITRAEFRLLEAHGREILAHASMSGGRSIVAGTPLARIVELGPGNGTKLRTLLDAGETSPRSGYNRRPLELHLIDVSGQALRQAEKAMASLEGIHVVRHEHTYEDGLRELAAAPLPGGRSLVLFLGSNLGNFDRPGAEAFLRTIRAALGSGDTLLIGVDLVKPEVDLLLAYDDPLGVTAAFNRNLLVRINRELGGDVDLDAFGHLAVWNREESRVEMHLVSLKRQQVHIRAAQVDIVLDEGDTIWTESSYKFDSEELSLLLRSAGFRPVERWTAEPERFALLLVRAE
jgi:dimethylhistidine N-methyltransferase